MYFIMDEKQPAQNRIKRMGTDSYSDCTAQIVKYKKSRFSFLFESFDKKFWTIAAKESFYKLVTVTYFLYAISYRRFGNLCRA